MNLDISRSTILKTLAIVPLVDIIQSFPTKVNRLPQKRLMTLSWRKLQAENQRDMDKISRKTCSQVISTE